MSARTKKSTAAKSTAASTAASKKISTFFEPLKINSRKRSQKELPDKAENSPPPSKIQRTDMPSSPSTPTPPSKVKPDILTPSPEQKARMESNKLEAESRMIAKKFGADKIGLSWMKALHAEFKKPYISTLASFLSEERSKETVFPPPEDVFSWTLACSIHDVKVVMLGQDPYHGPGQAHGLCFSVRVGVTTPPSLRNMYKELSTDVEGFTAPTHGHLMGWARQGVLLLNACLTVRHKQANSHAGKGWEKLTDAIVHWLNDQGENIVFMLWGSHAQKKGSFINQKKHCVLKSVHPSPLSAHRGFIGCKHFSKANDYLTSVGKNAIDWKDLPSSINVLEE